MIHPQVKYDNLFLNYAVHYILDYILNAKPGGFVIFVLLLSFGQVGVGYDPRNISRSRGRRGKSR